MLCYNMLGDLFFFFCSVLMPCSDPYEVKRKRKIKTDISFTERSCVAGEDWPRLSLSLFPASISATYFRTGSKKESERENNEGCLHSSLTKTNDCTAECQ